jgi:hypothetical protein
MNLFKCASGREVLLTYLNSMPNRGHGEMGKIAKRLNVSTTWISQVAAGKKLFTSEQANEFADYLKLTNLETDFVLTLIQIERAGTPKLRSFWGEKISQIKRQAADLSKRVTSEQSLSDSSRAIYYSSAQFSAVRAFLSVGSSGKTLPEVVSRFQISRARAAEILDFLIGCGLCRKHNDSYLVGPQKLHLEQSSPFSTRHHSNWRVRALKKAENLSPDELMYTGLVSLSYSDFEKLRGEMLDFVQKFLRTVHDSPAEDTACFNLDFFWIDRRE